MARNVTLSRSKGHSEIRPLINETDQGDKQTLNKQGVSSNDLLSELFARQLHIDILQVASVKVHKI